jgi:hypothetical protein
MLKFASVFIISLFLFSSVCAQTTRVRGKITDNQTHEPLSFVSVSFKGINKGTLTNDKGNYFLETRMPVDTLIVSSLGYATKKYKIIPKSYQVVDIAMENNVLLLNEVVVRPGENPAHVLLRKVIANKEKNDFQKLPSYNYECYNKIQFDINNIDERLKKKRIMKQLGFVFDYIDTSVVNGKRYLPVLLIESLSDYYYQSNPETKREVIKATRLSGIKNESVAQFTGMMYQNLSIYNNYVNVFNQGLVSPIADMGLLFYKYHLIDSTFIDGTWCYQLSVKPRRKQEPTFTGFVWIADTSFAVKKYQLQIAEGVNLNYVNDLVASGEYRKANDSVWVPLQQNIFLDLNLTNKTVGFFGRKTTTYKNFRFDKEMPKEVKEMKNRAEVDEEAMNKDNAFWDTVRHVPLTKKEERIYDMVDSIKKAPIFRTFTDILGLFINHYYDIGYIGLGPYYTLYSFNPIEGNRFKLGFRTTKKFSTKVMFDGFLAYGTRDKEFKYGLGFVYKLSKKPNLTIGANFENDLVQLGKTSGSLSEDNFIASVLRRHPNDKLTFVYERKVFVGKDWFDGFSNNLSFRYRRINQGEYVPFIIQTGTGQISVPNITTSEITLSTRLAINEKYYESGFKRVSLGTRAPVFTVDLTTGLKNIFNSSYNYFKINVKI